MRLSAGLAALAMVIFLPLFYTEGAGAFDFWWWITTNAALLTILAATLDPSWRHTLREDLSSGIWWKLGLGLASATLLYGIFWVGNEGSRWLVEFAGESIDAVYDFKRGASVWRVALLIGLLIGPAEELFWRHFLQRRLETRWGRWWGFGVATFLYTLMHITSFNPMLILAAGVCGVFWGLMYMKWRSAWLNVVSHVVWDLTVFLIIPFH